LVINTTYYVGSAGYIPGEEKEGLIVFFEVIVNLFSQLHDQN